MGACERDEAARSAWQRRARSLDPKRLVFVDECGTHIGLVPLRARAPRDERAFGRAPGNRGKNTTLIASITAKGMGPCVSIEGTTTKVVFEAYVEQVLVPSLRPGQVVIVDNLRAHKGERVRGLVEGKGCEILYLPAYSPDLNPIEQAFSKIKAILRRAQARTQEALVRAIERALEAVGRCNALGWFAHCGYPHEAPLT